MNCCKHKYTAGQACNVTPKPQGYAAGRDISNEKMCFRSFPSKAETEQESKFDNW